MFNLGFAFLLSVSTAFASQEPKAQSALRRIDDRHIGLSIYTPKEEGVQAAAFVNAAELPQVIEMFLQDPNSELTKIKKAIEEKSCPGVPAENIREECGRVEYSVAAQTAFGRGGWMDGGAAWATFTGFRDNGTGRFYEAQYGFVINEDVVAQVDNEGEYTGELVKTYTFVRVFPYTDRQQKKAAPKMIFSF